MEKVHDVIIIGAGVVGSGVARELSRYDLDILVLEKAEDVCCGTSKANSGIVHAGFDAKPGTKMAEYNVRGAALMPDLCSELDVPYKNNGSLVLCFDEDKVDHLETLKAQGEQNGVKDLQILTGEEVRKLEPCVSDEVVAALYAPTAGIVDPFMLTVAYAENASVNGVQFRFNDEVQGVARHGDEYEVKTDKASYQARTVVNASGLSSDVFYNSDPSAKRKLHITPRRGSYVLLDKKARPVPEKTLFQLPTKFGKGILVAPTCHGNTIVGPTAVDITDKGDTETTADELADVMAKARLSVPSLPLNMTITSFAGLRAHEDSHEFVIEELSRGYFHLVGIESPGLTSAPALALDVSDKVAKHLEAQRRPDFVSTRKSVTHFMDLSKKEQEELLQKDPSYAYMICRCEMVTEGEIREALKRTPQPRTLDGLKRRLRIGMGRCQGGFCSPVAMTIVADEINDDITAVKKAGEGSVIAYNPTKRSLS